MYVILPADELLLMTYGAAIPRFKPRPTLDCLREPKVPIEFPKSFKQKPTTTKTTNTETFQEDEEEETTTTAQLSESVRERVNFSFKNFLKPKSSGSAPKQTSTSTTTKAPVYTAAFTYDVTAPPCEENIINNNNSRASPSGTSQSLPPTPTRRNSITTAFKRFSVRSKRSEPPTPPSQQRQFQQQNYLTTNSPTPPPAPHPTTSSTFSTSSMYNETNMRSSSNQNQNQRQLQKQQQQQNTGQRPLLERSSAIRSSTPQRGFEPDPGYNYDEVYGHHHYSSSGGGGGVAASMMPFIEYPTGALLQTRDRSPSIFLEPPTPDPTLPMFGPGWGRPMSPMELPPESSTSNKSPTSSSKSRLRPKLHIPLGRLGRSSSSDQRESQRLKEDLHLHVENPVFNSENIAQKNFDAFFESGEPVYKIQPKTPSTAPANINDFAGVYDSSPRTRRVQGGKYNSGGLFARSPREEKSLNARSKSADHYEVPREARASSVISGGAASTSGTGAGSGGGGAGVPHKGDRFLGKIFKWKKKS